VGWESRLRVIERSHHAVRCSGKPLPLCRADRLSEVEADCTGSERCFPRPAWDAMQPREFTSRFYRNTQLRPSDVSSTPSAPSCFVCPLWLYHGAADGHILSESCRVFAASCFQGGIHTPAPADQAHVEVGLQRGAAAAERPHHDGRDDVVGQLRQPRRRHPVHTAQPVTYHDSRVCQPSGVKHPLG